MMITYRTTGKELYKELEKEMITVRKEQKKKRDSIRKKTKTKTLPYQEFAWKWTSPGYNKWFIKTSLVGSTNLPTITSHAHITALTTNGANYYVIPRGFKPRPNGDVGGYVVTIPAAIVREMKQRLQLDNESNDEVISRIFSYDEKATYFPCSWNLDEEEKKEEIIEEKPEDYIPTAEEIWAEYDKEFGKPSTKKSSIKEEYKDLGQLILKTTIGFFLGYIRDQKEIILDAFLRQEDFDEETQERIKNVINPAYELYNAKEKRIVESAANTLKENITGDEEVYLLYP